MAAQRRAGGGAARSAEAMIRETITARSELLDLSGLGLTELPQITQLLADRLTTLILDDNNLAALPEWIKDFGRLETIRATGNLLAGLPDGMKELASLKILILDGNRLPEIAPQIKALRNLERLSLERNELTELPQWLAELPRLRELAVRDNALRDIPPEVLNAGPSTVLHFVKDRRADHTDPRQWRAKVMLVGFGGAGKTSLVKSLLAEPFDPGEQITKGMRLAEFDVPHPDRPDVTLRLGTWDLGGQEIFDSTHQLFMTAGSVVLLVFDGRRGGSTELVRWLDILTDRIADAPVLIVATRASEFRPHVPLDYLADEYPQIVDLIPVDNRDGTGIEQLRTAIAQLAVRLPSVGKPWAPTWFAVAEALLRQPEATLPAEAVWRIADEAGLHEQSRREMLLSVLHERGDLVYLRDPSRITQRIVLRPSWLNEAVYRLLDHAHRYRRPFVTRADLQEVWAEESFADRDLFLDTMAACDLGWRLGGDDEAVFVVVQELPEHPAVARQAAEQLADQATVRIRYQFTGSLPVGVPGRFLARIQGFAVVDLWRDGAILRDGGNLASVVAEPDAAAIRIEVTGTDPSATKYLLEGILRESMPPGARERLTVEIPCPCGGNGVPCPIRYGQKMVAAMLATADRPLDCPHSQARLRPSRLLFGIDSIGAADVSLLLTQVLATQRDLGRRFDEVGQGMHALGEGQGQLLRGQEILAHGQVETCPSTFVVVPIGRGIKVLGSKAQLRLYCEAPGNEHPLPEGTGCYEIKDPATWLRKIGPWLVRVSRIIKVAVPVTGALMGVTAVELNDRRSKDLEHIHALLQELKLEHLDLQHLDKQLTSTDKALKKASSIHVPDHILVLPDTPRGAEAASYADSEGDYRVVRELLKHLDSQRRWGGLSAHVTSGGTVYVCQDHLNALGGFRKARG